MTGTVAAAAVPGFFGFNFCEAELNARSYKVIMKITILTICPEQFGDFQRTPLIARAVDAGLLELSIIDIRDYAPGSFRHVDDSPYGGGKPYVQADAHRLAAMEELVLICGHYEGMDARIYPYADEILSIGDYVLTGGELPAMVICDSLMRLVEGSMKKESTVEESFEEGLLEYPQYTRPADYKGQKVPEVLLSGDHEAIRKWRQEEALRVTKERRPDLLK